MMRTDKLGRPDYASNLLLGDFVKDFDDELDVRRFRPIGCSVCVTYPIVNVRRGEFPTSVLQADTIVASCELTNFERTSWSTQRGHEFWDLAKHWTQGQTTASWFTVLKTTTLKYATVVQCG